MPRGKSKPSNGNSFSFLQPGLKLTYASSVPETASSLFPIFLNWSRTAYSKIQHCNHFQVCSSVALRWPCCTAITRIHGQNVFIIPIRNPVPVKECSPETLPPATSNLCESDYYRHSWKGYHTVSVLMRHTISRSAMFSTFTHVVAGQSLLPSLMLTNSHCLYVQVAALHSDLPSRRPNRPIHCIGFRGGKSLEMEPPWSPRMPGSEPQTLLAPSWKALHLAQLPK